MKEMIIEREKKKLAEKNAAGVANIKTQAKEDTEDDNTSEDVAIVLESDGMPTREEMLKIMVYLGVGVYLNFMSDQDQDNDDKKFKLGFASLGDTQHPIETFYNKKEVKFDRTSKPEVWVPRLHMVTLCECKLYLDSCATYHSTFVNWCLENLHDVSVHLTGHSNGGTTTFNKKGYYGLFKMWLNKNGIANLLSIPQLEQDGLVIGYNTKRNWTVTTPQGKEIVFRKDIGLCEGMPYIDMR